MRDIVGNAIHMELFQARLKGLTPAFVTCSGFESFRIGIETMAKQLIYLSVAMEERRDSTPVLRRRTGRGAISLLAEII
jgi:hypothetical protein